MVSNFKQEGRYATFNSPLGKDVLNFVRLNATEGLSELFEFRVEVVSDDDNVDFDQLLGVNCTVSVAAVENEDEERYFDGVLTEARWTGKRDDAYTYELLLRPWFWLLSKVNNCKIFSGKTVDAIIENVFSDNGFSDYKLNLTEDYPVLDHCVQYRESAFAFTSRLMEKYGIFYYFEHEDGKHTLILCDSVSSLEPLPNHSERIPFIASETDEFAERDHINNWSAMRHFQTGKVELNDFDYLRPSADLKGKSEASENYKHSDLEVYDYPGQCIEMDGGEKINNGEKLAKVILEGNQAADHRFQAAGNVANLTPGYTFSLEDHPHGQQNRKYIVVRASHSVVDESYRSGSGGSAKRSYQGSYELQWNDRSYRPEIKTPKPFIRGPQTATVVGPKGEEIHVDEHGRVKVHFHWDRYLPYDETASCWIRVAQTSAGNGWGAIMIPRINHEVIVEFLEGDPDRPVIIGNLYNGENKVPYELPGNKTMSGFKSNSSKGGGGYNELVFEDKKGEELIRAHAEKDLDIKVKNNETRKVDIDQTIDIGNDVTEKIGNNMTIDVGSTVTITAGTKIELKVGVSKIVMDPTSITIESLNVMVKGQFTTVKGDGTLTLQGGMVNIN